MRTMRLLRALPNYPLWESRSAACGAADVGEFVVQLGCPPADPACCARPTAVLVRTGSAGAVAEGMPSSPQTTPILGCILGSGRAGDPLHLPRTRPRRAIDVIGSLRALRSATHVSTGLSLSCPRVRVSMHAA
jgi:hypothetical protein